MQEGGFETPLLPYLWVLSIAGKYRPRQGPKADTKAESRAFVSREAGVQRDKVSPQPVGKCSLSEPTVPTPHSLFVSPKRERAVDGTREKGDRGSQGRLVRPPPDPLLSVRLTEVCAYRKISEIEKHPKGCFFLYWINRTALPSGCFSFIPFRAAGSSCPGYNPRYKTRKSACCGRSYRPRPTLAQIPAAGCK